MVETLSVAISWPSQDSVTGIITSSQVGNGRKSTSQDSKASAKKAETSDKVKNISKETLERTVQALKNYIESNKRHLNITVHEQTGIIIVRVISEKDGRVIREVPPEKFLDLAASIEEFAGSLFNETA